MLGTPSCLRRRTPLLAGKGEDRSSPSPLSPGGHFPLFTGVPLSGTGRPRCQSPARGVLSAPPQGEHTPPPAGLHETTDGRAGTSKPSRVFLSSPGRARQFGRAASGRDTRANYPPGFDPAVLLATVSPLTADAATPGKLPSPSDRTRRGTIAPPHPPGHFVRDL
jgi:hypothetical protein